jgi:hypothetical protein
MTQIEPSAIAWLALLGAALAYEAVALLKRWRTLSQVVWSVSARFPLVPFLAGVLCGHFFWRK